MSNYKKAMSASDWLAIDNPIERWDKKVKRMSVKEQEQMLEEEDFVNTLLYKKYQVTKQRIRYAAGHTSWENKYSLIEEYGDMEYGGSFKGQVKQAVQNFMKENYTHTGEIEEIGWYLQAAYASGVDYDILRALDALEQVLSHEELQQLYHDLPKIKEYYVTKGMDSKTADTLTDEWRKEIQDIIVEYIKSFANSGDTKKIKKYRNILK